MMLNGALTENAVELLGGSGLKAVTRPQQILLGLMKGEFRKAFERAVIDPRVSTVHHGTTGWIWEGMR